MKLINPEVRIENCSHCNAKCVICPREKMTRAHTVMPTGHFKSLVTQAKILGADTISVFGYGEPLIDPEVAKKVEYCTKLGLKTFITSNGSLLKYELAYKLLEAGLSHMRFSVHGTYNTYEKVHRGLVFADVTRNINNFTAAARLKSDCRVSISVIPMHRESIEDIKALWKDHELEIWKPHDWAGARGYRAVVQKKKTCGRPERGPVQINADGTMMVCCYDFDSEMTVGDTYQNSIEEILKGDEFNLIRKCHDTGTLIGLPCVNCDQLNIGDNPLIYSTIDPDCKIGKTSSTKFELEAA